MWGEIFEISLMWESIFIVPSHLEDKLVECKILDLNIIFLKNVKISFLCLVIFSVIFDKSSGILIPGGHLRALWKLVGLAFCVFTFLMLAVPHILS